MKRLSILFLLAICLSGCGYFKHDKTTIGAWEAEPLIGESKTILFWEQSKWTSPFTIKYKPFRTEVNVINGFNANVTFKMKKKVVDGEGRYYDNDKKYDFLMEDGTYYVIDSIGNLQEYNNSGHFCTYTATESITIGVKDLEY